MPSFLFDPKQYPTNPGCYLMKDAGEKVIYVGKANNLRRRLASYFRKNPGYGKIERLVEEIQDVEVILVHNEVESLVLEHNLIKRYRPRYNSFLVSEKSGYPYIMLTQEEFPRFVRYKRNVMNKPLKGLTEEDCERRFGPYLSHQFIEELLNIVTEKFSLRVCDPIPPRACLLFHMARCSAPCENRITRNEYHKTIQSAADFLSQPNTSLIQQMRLHMEECAGRLEFERAQRIKMKLEALERGIAQQVVERDIAIDQGVFYFGEGKVLTSDVRRGILTSVALHDLPKASCVEDAPGKFLLDYYQKSCPPQLLANAIPHLPEIERTLSSVSGHHVRIILPKYGPELDLVRLCELNYHYRVERIQ